MSVRPSSYQPRIESLEARDVPTSSIQAYITGGNLYIVGSSGNDAITVIQYSGQVSVTGAKINLNGSLVSSVSTSSFSKVFIYGEGGNDAIDFSTVKSDVTVYAGTGDDTIRCGTGNSTINNGGGFDSIYHMTSPWLPIINGTTPSDIQQGYAPLCQTAAALAEAAQQGHNFAGDITYLGNNYFQVKLYGGLTTQKVYFDGWTTSNDPAVSANGEYWQVLLQRARLQTLGINPNLEYTPAQWDAFNQKTGGKLYSIGDALSAYTGDVVSYNNINALSPQALQSALVAKQFVIAQSHISSSSYVSGDGIIGNHAYAVLSVYYENGIWKVRLYNPWGTDSINGRTIDSLDTSHPASNDGYITLSWQQFINTANFSYLYIAKK
jgi:hypothetical protein